MSSSEIPKKNIWPVGTAVRIENMRLNGRFLQLKGKDRALVEVEGKEIICALADLALAETSPQKKKDKNGVKKYQGKTLKGCSSGKMTKDLHGLTAESARHACIDALNEALLADVDCLEIIHGKGSGILEKVVREFFTYSPSTKKVISHPNNPGITLVYLG